MERCSIREAALKLQDWFAPPQPRGPSLARGRQNSELVREKEARNLPLRFALTGVDHSHPYLRQCGIDFATALEFGVGFYNRGGRLSGRIVIPIRNQAGEIVAYRAGP